MREGRALPRAVLVVILALGVFVLVALMYLAARFFAWAFAVLILYGIVKGVTRVVGKSVSSR